MEEILKQIIATRNSHDGKWGFTFHVDGSPLAWAQTMQEELDDTFNYIHCYQHSDYRESLIQIGAMVLAALENLDRNENKQTLEILKTWKEIQETRRCSGGCQNNNDSDVCACLYVWACSKCGKQASGRGEDLDYSDGQCADCRCGYNQMDNAFNGVPDWADKDNNSLDPQDHAA